jgi:hypothetical protein
VKSTTTPKKPFGRPSEYTPEMATAICEDITQGMSLRSALLSKGRPDAATLYRWMNDNEDFRKQYAQATRDRADAQFEELNSMGEVAMEDAIKYKDDPRFANVVVAVYKLKADNMKWAMAKMKPKKYSERLELDDLPPNAIVFVNEVPAPQHNSPTGDLLPDDQSDPDPNIS